MRCFRHLLMSLWGARLAEGSTLRTRASDAGWLNGNISKRAVDLVPCLRFAPLRFQISSSFCLISHPFPSNSFFENMRHRCIQNSLLPVPIEYILVQRVLRPAEAVAWISLKTLAASWPRTALGSLMSIDERASVHAPRTVRMLDVWAMACAWVTK